MFCLDSSQIMKRNLWILKINCPKLLMNLLIGVSLGVTFQTVQWSFWLEIYLVEKLSLDLPAEDESWCLIQFSCEWEIKRDNLKVIKRLQLLSSFARSSLTILNVKSSNFPALYLLSQHTKVVGQNIQFRNSIRTETLRFSINEYSEKISLEEHFDWYPISAYLRNSPELCSDIFD